MGRIYWQTFKTIGLCRWFCLGVMSCLAVLVLWYPATHAARRLLEDDAFIQTWYVFWILPLLFIGLHLLFVVLFYLMAFSLNRSPPPAGEPDSVHAAGSEEGVFTANVILRSGIGENLPYSIP